ncbi:hypothetical protein EDD21DRAFT_372724 [Dissophora ornata]|nr:hypothetical protein EDD21DRAFT_372724 [Dissophora ornata]
MAGGASLFLSAFVLVIAWYIANEGHQKGKTLQHAFNFITGNLLRIWSLFYTPLALSAMYQLTIPEETVMLAIASVSLLIFSIGAIVLLTWRILRASTQRLLFGDLGILLKYGPLYNTLSEEGTLFFLVNLLVRFLWGLSIAMLSAYGVAQVAVLLAVELGYMLVIGFRWPFSDSGDNKFHLVLGFVRVVITGCSVVYIQSLNASPEVRQLFGYIQMALHLAVFIVMFALILWNTIQVVLFWRSRHTAAWRGPTKNYSFENTVEVEHDWVLTGRPLSRRPEPALVGPMKSRRYTVEPYSSITDLRSVPEDDLMSHPSLYRHSHQPTSYRRSRFPSDDSHNLAQDMQSDAIIPLSSSPGPMSARSVSPHSPSIDSMDGSAIPLQPTQLSSTRSQLPKDSYARFQRMTHQQETPDLRNRRMSEIFRDGRYLYDPNETVGSSPAVAQSEENQSIWKSMKGPFGGLFTFGKQSVKKPAGDGSKPKAFEVIRPPRPPPVGMDTVDDLSQIGDDNLRELNSIGISRFFQESGRNNDQNRSLFVANPEAIVSQTVSLRSSISGIPFPPPHLNRTISAATAGSVYTLGHRHRASYNVSADLTSMLSGIGLATSEQGYPDSRRISTLSSAQQQRTYPRNSVESNIAEALRSETPLKLQGGGILKVSKGPEKAVQYWRKKSGQYVDSSADPSPERRQTPLPLATPPLLLLPTTRGPLFDAAQIDTSTKAAPSVRSRAGSRAESPTESHNSSNVAASAGRMHEILDRMFSDQDDDSDTISEDEESCSTFSGRVSATIMALHQKRELEEFADAQSLYRSDTLEPVLEHLGPDADGEHGSSGMRPGASRSTSSSSRQRPMTLMRTFSGPVKPVPASPSAALLRPSRSGSFGRPLAQTPLRPPSVLTFSGSATSLYLPATLSRQSSRTSLWDHGGSSLPRLASSDISAQSPTTSFATQDSIPMSETTLWQNDSFPGKSEILDPLGEEPVTVSEPKPDLMNYS